MNKIFYIVIFFVFISCESRTNYKKPKDLIPKDQMIDLLTDMHKINGITGIKNKDGLKANNYISVLYEKYQIDSTRFASSNLYYTSKISEYEKIFKEVKKRIEGQRILFEDDSLILMDPKGKELRRPDMKQRNKDAILK
ncbi:MAG: DUF4296 domain-containing protein [Bacteroidetes bacterium]|nr:MAG: DUF4296 domain-containing protein [Bacteroidota bacterium]